MKSIIKEGDCLYRAGVDVEADEGGSIEHGSPFHECGVAAAAELDTHHCRPNPRSFMQQGLSMFLCPAHIVYTYDSQLLPLLRACKTRFEDHNTFFVFSESDHFFDERDS
mgnify:CR=1 FL=1